MVFKANIALVAIVLASVAQGQVSTDYSGALPSLMGGLEGDVVVTN